MANTYTQLHIQLIFAVKFRKALIDKAWNERLHQYITGIFQLNRHKMLQINSVPDHIHILFGLRPHQAISALVQNVKCETTKWIKYNNFCRAPFEWQDGFGAFSYTKNELPKLIEYIQNQEEHHKVETFLHEYERFLIETETDYDLKYIFKPLE
jgi:putative transposase